MFKSSCFPSVPARKSSWLNILAAKVFVGIFSVLLLLGAGCATTLPPQYQQSKSFTHSPSHISESIDGLDVSVDWLNDKATTEAYFDVDASKGDFLILSLHFENKSPDSTFLLLKTNFAASVPNMPDSSIARDQMPGTGKTGAESVLWVGAGVLPLTPIIGAAVMTIGAGLMTGAEAKAHNFQVQEFQDRTVSPGQSAEGCVYYRLPDVKKRLEGFTFEVKAENVRTRETKTMVFEIQRNQ